MKIIKNFINKFINKGAQEPASWFVEASTVPLNNIKASSVDCIASYNYPAINQPRYSSLNGMNLSLLKLDKDFKKLSHEEFTDLPFMKTNNYAETDFWRAFRSTNQKQCAWKIHIYSVDEEDWQKTATLLAPYLNSNDIEWKTFSEFANVNSFGNPKQIGKAFTIYPHDNDEFMKLTYDIDYILRNNNLVNHNSKITGDRKLGDTGKIFYRYEFNTGEYKDTILNLDDYDQKKLYFSLYQSNRDNDNYLAYDMTTADDPWYYYNPGTGYYIYD